MIKNPKQARRRKIHLRGKVEGNALKPRLSIYKSNTAFYVQLIDDERRHTLLALDTRKIGKKNKESVLALAQIFAERLKKLGVTKFFFHRSGYLYHGLVKEFSQALHALGLSH